MSKGNLLKSSLVALLLFGGVLSAEAEVIKIGYIDPLSGPFGSTGDAGVKHFRYAAEEINAAGGMGGMQVEVVAFDNKINPKESLVQLQKAIDQGVRFIAQGNGSSVANALTDAIAKHNKRNPGEEVLFLNYAAVDPALTNKKCNYWHFRFDAHVDMKMAGLTDWLRDQKDIKSAYILAQDYSYGRAFTAAAKSMIEEKRPDIKIVGAELHPIGKVKDFTPYVQKMMSAKADVVFTGNWGTDMTLLVKAANASGHTVPYLTFYGGGLGAPTAMGKSAVGLVKQITEFHENIEASEKQMARVDDFEKTNSLDYYYERVFTLMNMLDKAVDAVGSVDVPKVAAELEGMTYETPYGEVTMRADDHQLMQPLYISTFSEGVARDVENTGYGFKTDITIPAAATETPTTCRMRRPS
ncbi:Leucine-, isoleucine-, valine-, threonine-, and alanine-binding protein precursor [Pseudovibrio sp. Ad5]|uniref:branched-chain amino acid ABC transporter substrate-binding protein n=1 Tax=unclassified Pseudovibrio TaxID=2627060 RepID=UPI000710E28D|nr:MULTISPECIES: branched-chain amino acid ABC transporter substrate-binding protein [unclassified Pseudovibrio]KZL02116.1 Leucine-, isoleucine-, valine-, threonine-, and alanine-binding protein precursor [Pseudovibrio sp. Ad5]